VTRLFFVVNHPDQREFAEFTAKYLADCTIEVGTSTPPAPERYRLIVLWNYRSVVHPIPTSANVVLFHGSDLPQGRGWAPIYHALSEGASHYTVSGILAAEGIDCGDIVVKARFPILPQYTAADLRRFDAEISVMLLGKIIRRFAGRRIVGVPQAGVASYRRRRTPDDGEIDITKPFATLIQHLRACEPEHPAFFYLDGVKYLIQVAVAERASFPSEISIEFGVPE
jgi:methionyl-tRNA formyltransferase